MRQRLRPLLALIALGGALVVGCGSDGDDGESASPPATEASFDELVADAEDLTGRPTVEIDVVDNLYQPVAVTVDAGTTITWTNAGRNDHNVTPAADGSFEDAPTADFAPGASHEATFDTPGTFGYFCSIHGTASQGQRGVIVVS